MIRLPFHSFFLFQITSLCIPLEMSRRKTRNSAETNNLEIESNNERFDPYYMENWPTLSAKLKKDYKDRKSKNFDPMSDKNLLKSSKTSEIEELTNPEFKNNEFVTLKKRTSVNADPIKLKKGEQVGKMAEWDVKILGSFVETSIKRSKKESTNMYLVELNDEIVKVQEKYLIRRLIRSGLLRLAGRHLKSTHNK